MHYTSHRTPQKSTKVREIYWPLLMSIKGVHLSNKASFALDTNTCVSKHQNVELTAKQDSLPT